MNKEGLKIIKAEIRNFKNITEKTIDFGGKSALIIGANTIGKSSLLQAIQSPLNAKFVPSKPIKEGEEKGSVELEIAGTVEGEYMRYFIDMYFNDRDKKGRLVIKDEDGGDVPGGKSMISSIVGNIGFDIFEFISLGQTKDGKVSKPGVKQQIEILKSFLSLEDQKKLSGLDSEKKEIYDSRTEINREIKFNEAKIVEHDLSQDDIQKYSKKMDDSALKEELINIGEEISKYDRIKNGVEDKAEERVTGAAYIENLKEELRKATEKQAELEDELVKGRKWLENRERPSVMGIEKKMVDIEEHNIMHRIVSELSSYHANLLENKKLSEAKTDRYKKIDKEKAEIFKSSKLPVKGLEFTDDEILYKGLPFNETQHPSSTIIGIGIKIAMAMNPNLRLLTIKDGSLLDKKTRDFILKIVEEKGYQIFIEIVDFEGGDLKVEFIES